MDVASTYVPVVEEKRDVDGEREEESVAPPPPLKKPRFDEEVNRVAEIVLVLSALRRIRGGKTPTEFELELMVEAKSKLVEMCQEFTPKDIIGRDAIGSVIEDLGLNGKLKDQRLGFRAPKLSISEKLSLGKRKMEESKKHTIVSTSYTSPGQSVSANNISMAHQWPNSEMKPLNSSVNASGSHFVRDASGVTQSRSERPLFKSDMRASAAQGSVPGGNYFGNATSWSAQAHSSPSTISFGTPSDSKVTVQSSSRVSDPSFRPFMSQTPPGTFPGMKGVSYGQTSSAFGNNHHAEIAKIIHKVLQPRAKQNILWNPPSREYMTKAMACQICQGTINEVETVLICDACEKGYHLKCLQANNMKGVPKSEWHCSRCVQLYNGKSLPPKYGRVMRSATTAKMSSGTAEVQSPADKKVGKVILKVNQEAMQHPQTSKPTEDSATDRTVESEDAAAASQRVEAEEAAAIGETVEAKDAAATNQMAEAEDAAAGDQTVVAENAAAIGQTVEAEDAAAIEQTVEAEDAAAIGQTVEAADAAAISQKVEAEDAAATSQTVEAEDAPAVSQTVEAGDAAAISQTVEAEDAAAISQTVEAEGASTNRAVDTEYDDPSEPASRFETVHPPEVKNKEDPSKDGTEEPVSANRQDDHQMIIAEPSLQEENSDSQTENLLPHSPPLQSNTDHSQQHDTTPNLEENREEDGSCG